MKKNGALGKSKKKEMNIWAIFRVKITQFLGGLCAFRAWELETGEFVGVEHSFLPFPP